MIGPGRRRQRRQGAAPAEFVMVLPLLTALFALIFGMGYACVVKLDLTVQTRHQAWLQRDQLPGPSRPLDILDISGLGAVRFPPEVGSPTGVAQANGSSAVPQLFLLPGVTVQSGHSVYANSGDYHTVELGLRPPLVPHPQAATVSGGGVGIFTGFNILALGF